MTKITGTITTFLAALGHSETDREVRAIIEKLGGKYDTTSYNDTGIEEKYLTMQDQGVDLLLEDGILSAMFIYPTWSMERHDEHNSYNEWPALIDGLKLDAVAVDDGVINFEIARDAVRAVFDEPARSATLYDLYKVDNRFVHFEFDESSQLVSKLTLMANDPLANSLVGPADASTAVHVDGTLNTLISALGHYESDSEAQAAFTLFEAEYTSGNPSGGPDVVTRYLNFPDAHIQLKNDCIASIYFTTGLVFNDPIPEGLRINKLIEGLAEKPMRADVQAILGKPYLKDITFDLYNVNNASIHMEYINDIPDSIAVSTLPTKESYQ